MLLFQLVTVQPTWIFSSILSVSAHFWDFSVVFFSQFFYFSRRSSITAATALVASWVREKGVSLYGICYCIWLDGHSSWMWWMLGGRRSRRGKKKSRRKKGLKRWKKQQRKIFISIFHIHSRDISIMDIFLMPRTCYMLMLMLFHLIFPFPTPHTHRSLFSFLFSSSSSFEWLLKWDFLNREREKTCEGRVCCFCWAGWSSTLLCINFISFFLMCHSWRKL